MTGGTSAAQPAAVRQLDTPAATALADLAAMFEDLQTVLRCCEKLVTEIDAPRREPDAAAIEAFWTTAVLSYARCFATGGRGMGLTEEDITGLSLEGELLDWHKVLRQLAVHYADPRVNPREIFSVGVAQDADGAPSGVAITSARQPLVDDVTVRQTGAVVYELLRVVDKRISEHQERVLQSAQAMSKSQLERLPLLDVELSE